MAPPMRIICAFMDQQQYADWGLGPQRATTYTSPASTDEAPSHRGLRPPPGPRALAARYLLLGGTTASALRSSWGGSVLVGPLQGAQRKSNGGGTRRITRDWARGLPHRRSTSRYWPATRCSRRPRSSVAQFVVPNLGSLDSLRAECTQQR